MYMGFYEEGDHCPEPKCKGTLEFTPVEGCSCHINPPCSKCVDQSLTCAVCGWKPDEPEHRDVVVTHGLSMREYKPRPFDPKKIDYRIKMHTHFSQICEGVYPEGTTRDEVRKIVNGTFGGRFESFGGGKFRFIAYTD